MVVNKQLKIVCYEKVDVDALNYILKNIDGYMVNLKRRGGSDFFTDEELKTYTTIIKNYASCVKKSGKYKGFKQTIYTQRREKITRDEKSYTKHFGRLFPECGLSLCSLSRVLRHTIAGNFYFDLDISNCHPTILLDYCLKKGIVCNALQNFVENRHSYYDSVKSYLGNDCSPKKIFVSLINNGTFPTPDCEKLHIEQGDVERRVFPTILSEFIIEIKNIINDVCLKEPEFYAIAESLEEERMKERGYVNPKGSCINYMMCERECNILLFMKNELSNMGWIRNDSCVLCWDGIMIERNFDLDTLKLDLSKIENAINSHFEMKQPIHLAVKEMEEGFANILPVEIPDCAVDVPKATTYGDYLTNKKTFEETNFKLLDETLYCEETHDNRLIRRKQKVLFERFRNLHFYNEEDDKLCEFVGVWTKDKDLRSYKSVGVYPEGAPVNVYNMWRGFHADKFVNAYIEQDKIVDKYSSVMGDCSMFINLVRRLCNYDDTISDYVFKVLAQIIQYPHIKINIALVIKSFQGAGKDTLYKILEKVIGSRYCFNTADVDRDLFGRFNDAIENKILIALNETSVVESSKHAQKFKDFISCSVDKIEEKGLGLREVRSMCRYFVFTNSDFAIKVEERERRLFVIDCKQPQLSLEESVIIYNAMENERNIATFYQYLLNIDIEGYDFVRNRPITQYQEDLKEASLPTEHLFLRDYCQRSDRQDKIFTSDFYTEFICFSSKLGYKDCCKLPTFALKIAKYATESDSGISRSGNGNVFIDGKQAKGYSFDFVKMANRFG